MQITTSALAAILALTSSATATPLEARQDALKDWQVTGVQSYTPSGRPGSYPWATLTANITDPNTINLGPAKSDGTPVTVPAGSQGIVRLLSTFNLPQRLIPFLSELRSKILHQRREPARPHVALRRYHQWLLDHASPCGVERAVRLRRLQPEIQTCSGCLVPRVTVHSDI
jgi:hypothetical protein